MFPASEMQATESSELSSSDESCVLYKAHEKVPIISDQHHVFCDVDIQRDELTRCMDGVSRKMLRTLRHLEITQHIIMRVYHAKKRRLYRMG